MTLSYTVRSSNVYSNVTISDNNSSLRLSQGWQEAFSANTISGSYQFATGIEEGLQLSLPINTVAFYYYGIKQTQGALYGICVDCLTNSSGTLFDTIDGHNGSGTEEDGSVILYFRDNLDPQIQHSLALVNFPDERFDNSSTITLDAFVVTVTGSGAPNSESGISTSTSQGLAATGSPLQLTAENHLRPGAIAGITIGSILVFISIIVALTILALRRRHRRRKPFIQIQQISYPVTTDLPARRRDLLARSGFVDRYPQFSFRRDAQQVGRSRSGILSFLGQGHRQQASNSTENSQTDIRGTRPILSVVRDHFSQPFSRINNDGEVPATTGLRSRMLQSIYGHQASDHSVENRATFTPIRPPSRVFTDRIPRLMTLGRERLSDHRPSFVTTVDRRTSLSSISSWGSSQYDTIPDANSPMSEYLHDGLRISRPFPSPPMYMPRLGDNWELL